MKPPRFYAPDIALTHDFWVQDQLLVQRWRELGFQAGQQIVLFDGTDHDRLYRIEELSDKEAHLQHVTDFERHEPKREVYILWRPSKEDDVLKSGTAKDASHFMPLLDEQGQAEFSHDHAVNVVVEASEENARSTVPAVREPMYLQTALEELKGKVPVIAGPEINVPDDAETPLAFLLTPQNGWSASEQKLIQQLSTQS